MWRQRIPEFIDDNRGDIYHFGIWFGGSVCELANALSSTGKFRHLCFDSFEGVPLDSREPLWHPEWHPETGHYNAYSAKTWMQTSSVEEAVIKVKQFISSNIDEEFLLIPGYYENSLQSSLLKKFKLNPATYIDVDCDIYGSTIECLSFMINNNLIRKGTVIGFDDWKCTPDWENFSSGESRAWKELSMYYNIDWKFLYDTPGPVNPGAENFVIQVTGI